MTTGITNRNHWNQDSVAKDLKLTANQDPLDYSVKHSPADLKLTANQLTAKQEQIQEKLDIILDGCISSLQTSSRTPVFDFEKDDIQHLQDFLDGENSEDLKIVLNLRREDGTTMLHDVADFYDGVTELLLDAGADPDIPDKDGKTPLQIAIDYRRHSAVGLFSKFKQQELNKKLINLLDEINDTSDREKLHLKHSVDVDSIEALKKFLDDHKKENSEDLKVVLNLKRGELGSTVLHDVHSPFYTETFNLLLEAGADLNKQDIEGKTPLHYAANSNCLENIKALLNAKANPNIQDEEGKTPLHCINSLEGIRVLCNTV